MAAIRLKVIRPTFQTLTIHEGGEAYKAAGRKINDSASAANLFSFLAEESKEFFFAVHLNTKNCVVCIDEVSVGSMTAAVVHPREVFKSALLSSAAALVFIHNHPSGDPSPSSEDIALTRRLKEAGELLGIRVLDHVVIGEYGNYVSLADRLLI